MAVCPRCGRYEPGSLCARCGAPTTDENPAADPGRAAPTASGLETTAVAGDAAWASGWGAGGPAQPPWPGHDAATVGSPYAPGRPSDASVGFGPPYAPDYPVAQPRAARSAKGALLAGLLVGGAGLVIAGALLVPGLLAPPPPAPTIRPPATITVAGAPASAAPPSLAPAPTPSPTAQAAGPWTPAAGLYVGLCVQSDSPSYWTANVTLAGSRGTITYDSPSARNKCTGRLEQRADGTWLETIEHGSCTATGVWTFTPSTVGLRGSYLPIGDTYTLTSELVRQ